MTKSDEASENTRATLDIYIELLYLLENSTTTRLSTTTVQSKPYKEIVTMSTYTGPGLYQIVPSFAQNMSLNVWDGEKTTGTPIKL